MDSYEKCIFKRFLNAFADVLDCVVIVQLASLDVGEHGPVTDLTSHHQVVSETFAT